MHLQYSTIRFWPILRLFTAKCVFMLFALALLHNSLARAQNSEVNIDYSWKNVSIGAGGYITGIIFSPNFQNELYIRTDIGGAYRRNESGSWIPLFDGLSREDSNLNGILSIAIDPKNSNNVYFAAGTYTFDNVSNAAIIISHNKGKTWEKSELPFKLGANEDGRGTGERLIVDNENSNILWFGTSKNGLWQSNDGAKNWHKIGFDNQHILFVMQAKNRRLFISTKSGLYLSNNNGQNFSMIDNLPKDLMALQGIEGLNGEIYLTLGDKIGPNEIRKGAVVKLLQNGQIENISPSVEKPESFGFGGVSLNRQTGKIAVSTNNKWAFGDEIFIQSHANEWKSINAISSFDYSSNPWLKDYSLGELKHIGHWISDLEIDPFNPNHALYVTGYGLWETYNFGAPKIEWSFQNIGIEETAILDFAIPNRNGTNAAEPILYSAIGDISGFAHYDLDDTRKNKMITPFQGNGRSIDIAKNNALFLTRTTDKAPFGYYSNDGAKSWTAFATTPANLNGNGGIIRISADGKTIVWLVNGKVYYSQSNGNDWKQANGLSDEIKNAKLIADQSDPLIFYVYDNPTGNLHRSIDGAKNFEKTKVTLTNWSNSVSSAPNNPSHIWAATYNGLFASDNGGDNFVKIYPFDAAWAISFGKAAPGADYPTIFVAGKMGSLTGIFLSQDLGEKWLLLSNKDMQFSSLRLIMGDPNIFGRLYIGTDGRGIFYGDLKLKSKTGK